jgi:sulfate transport system permease protein
MSGGTHQVTLPRPAFKPRLGSALLSRGLVTTWLSLIVVLPLAFLALKASDEGLTGIWDTIKDPQVVQALYTTVGIALAVTVINCIMGLAIAWVLVRDNFPGKAILNAVIDLPFALPTIVAGIVLLSLYGNDSPIGVDLAYTSWGVMVALLFITLPFVVRSVQPTLIELDRDMEEAAASLGAGGFTIFRRIILPTITPAMVAGTTLAFARALSEFGSTVLISGNIPFKTQVAAVHVYGQIENDNVTGAAALSTVLLAVALVVLVALNLIQRWVARRD